MTKKTTAWDKYMLLSWKNWLIQFRHPIQTALEILIPVLVCGFLILIRALVEVTVEENPLIFQTINMEWIDEASFINMTRGIVNNTGPPGLHTPNIYYSPINPNLHQVVSRVASTINFGVQPFPNSSLLEGFAVTENPFVSIEFDDNLSGMVELPKNIQYAIRFPAELRRNDSVPNNLAGFSSNWATNIRFGIDFVPGPRNGASNDGGQPPGYIRQGFTMIQNLLERELIRHMAQQPLQEFPQLNVERYPYPEYVYDILGLVLEFAIPLIFMVAFLYSAVNNIKYIALEKELQLKEAMKIMGLPGYLHWIAWFTKCMLFQIVIISIVTGLVKIPFAAREGLAVFTHTHWSVLWVFFFTYALAGVTFSFMFSTFFSKANVAAISGAVAWLFMLQPYAIINMNYSSIGIWPKIAASLLVNSGMGFGFKVLGRYESAMIGVQWNNLFQPVTPDDDMTLGYVMLALLTASFLQMLVALYVEKVKPGEFGVPEPWYFPFTAKFWTGGSKVKVDAIPMEKNPDFEEEPVDKNAGIKIRGLRKVYGNKVAVNNLHLNIYEDEITVLLGHNGAGKSTTMGMLTGLFPPSSGTAFINGYDVRSDLDAVRGSLGLCPQHNVLFNELTVREHIVFFAKLKGIQDKNEIEEEIRKYVKLLGLEPKMNAQSSTLSGGMKRKLSIGIALCGNSKIVMCDEPSSGMDPAARRSLWDLLIQEKKGRTILLTTHFMDEADVLGDRIAIMSDGVLKTVGTSFFLKKRFGIGYRLIMVKKVMCNPNLVTKFLSKYISGIKIETNIGTELTYILPEEFIRIFKNIFRDLENNLNALNILSFGLSLTTLEEVFLKVGTDSVMINEEYKAPIENGNGNLNGINKFNVDSSSTNLLDTDLVYGFELFINQTLAMLIKKFYYTIRNYVMLIIMFFIPILFLVITMAFEDMLAGTSDLPELRISFLEYIQTVTVYETINPDASLNSIISSYQSFFQTLPAEHTLIATTQGVSMVDTILEKSRESLSNVNLNYMVGTTFASNEITVWFNNQAFHTVPLTVNLINNAILKALVGADYSITLVNKPLPFSLDTTLSQLQAGNNLGFNIALNTGFSFALVTACFVMFYIKERITKAKLLQIVSGVNKGIFWLVAFVFDYAVYFLIMMFYILIMAAYQKEGLSTFEELLRNTIVLLAFGLAVLPFTYVLSFAFRIPTTGLVSLAIGYIVTGTLFYTIYFTLHSELLDLRWISEPLGWAFLVFPHYSMTRAFSNLNIMQTTIAACDRNCEVILNDLCDMEAICNAGADCANNPLIPPALCDAQAVCCARSYFAFEETAIGIMLAALVVVAIVSFFILFIIEFKVFRTIINKIKNVNIPKNIPESEDGFVDSDVFAEKNKIRMLSPYFILKNNLVIKDLSKFYGNFMAVNQISVGVDKGECFGLLGVNGAGKTSTFKMLTGDENISAGDAWVEGMSIRNELNKVHQRIGYCPQFDALIDDLTGRETIKIFALLRGVPRKNINAVALQLADDLNFLKHLDKKTKEYSGGNKRKLSTALTLIGDPCVIYLDEPTSGMDVGARRQLWNMVIKTRNSGKSVVLTSHSMEECEVLCNRVAIQVNGEFKCLGSVQHLKNKFSKGFFLTIKTGHDLNMDRLAQKSMIIKDFVSRTFSNAVLKEEYMDILTYHIQSTQVKWSHIFGVMEDAKVKLNISDYSLAQTSLEQIFLFFTKYQRISKKAD